MNFPGGFGTANRGGSTVRFGVLGPLLVQDEGTELGVPAPRQRILLAALLARAGQPVSADALAETVWDEAPPAGAPTTLRSYVMRLRKLLGPAAGARLVTRYPGYLLEAGSGEVDLLLFAALLREGAAATRAGAWERAYGLLGDALGLWRGSPLTDVPSQVLHRDEVPRWVQMRVQALEWRAEAGLELGCHGELVPALAELAAEHPLRETLHARLMLALYRSGQQAEALEAYRAVRARLATELGIDPGPQLQELHQRMLASDPGLTPRAPRPAAGHHLGVAAGPVTPRQLPASARHFTGRAKEIQALTSLLEDSAGAPGTILISAIGGTAGVGKTALAVQWGHQVAERFPDGQLFVDLRGYDLEQPVPAADALAGFLRALGTTGQDVPADTGERAARYRSLMAGRRVLVVLDNARSADQVRPLLPASPGCMVLVTSRDSLAGLAARDGAVRLDLDLLPEADSAGLLRTLIGDRADASPATVQALAAQCCHLPLALRVAAELAAGQPAVPLAGLVAELADGQRRLEVLEVEGDPRTAVRAVFSCSYRHLSAGAARLFRLLGLHPGTDLDVHAAAAVAGHTAEEAGRLLSLLVCAHLVQSGRPGRYGMHDLLRAYARELAAGHDSALDRDAAVARLSGHYLHTAAAAMDILFPADRPRRPHLDSSPGLAMPPLATAGQARAWLDAERANLVEVTAQAAGQPAAGDAALLAATITRYLDTGGHYAEAVTVNTHARDAARRAGDHAGEAAALANLGAILVRQGQYEPGISHLQQALALCGETGDPVGEARARTNLGLSCFQDGRYTEAAEHHRQALALHRRSGDRTGQARALNNLGMVEERLGRYAGAAESFRQSLALYREVSNRTSEAYPLSNLGRTYRMQGQEHQAVEHIQRSVVLFRESGNVPGEAYALSYLGDAYHAQGRHQQAVEQHRQALELFRQAGGRPGQALALNGIGDALHAVGRPGQAHGEYRAALALASQIGDKYEQARAHDGIAHCHAAQAETRQARHHWQQALAVYSQLGVPQAAQVQRHLLAIEAGRAPATAPALHGCQEGC